MQFQPAKDYVSGQTLTETSAIPASAGKKAWRREPSERFQRERHGFVPKESFCDRTKYGQAARLKKNASHIGRRTGLLTANR